MPTYYYQSPWFTIALEMDQDVIYEVNFCDSHPTTLSKDSLVYQQLEEYFHGDRTQFSLPLSFHGTPFQEKVWRHLTTIPYGETQSYKQVAEAIGYPKAARAIGNACNKNPIALIIPCHRVTSASGLGGFGFHIDIKINLSEFESQSKE